MTSHTKSLSRREFARRTALATAASLLPVTTPAAQPLTAAEPPQGAQQEVPALSPQARAEADARLAAILAQYGDRFSEEQKKDLRRLCSEAQPGLEHLRAYAIQNGDSPALYLKPLVERESKPAAAATRGGVAAQHAPARPAPAKP